METRFIVSPESPPIGPNTNNPQHDGLSGQSSSQFQCVDIPVHSVVQSTSTSCVECQEQQQLHDQQHHYQEIGQNVLQNATNQRSAQSNPHSHHPPCCCGGPGTSISAPFYQPQYYHQHHVPESDPAGFRKNDLARSCRGPPLSSSTENLQSGCESQYSRGRKRTLMKKSKHPIQCCSEDVASLHSKSSRDVPTPSTANINDEMGSAKYSNQIEIYSEEMGNETIKSDEASDIEVVGPPLPPRLPMRPARITQNVAPPSPGVRKYVLWCLLCGGASGLLGIMFLGVYFLIRYYTSSLTYFETVPTFVPSTLLILTGLCIMSLARRRNRYTFLIKLSGACGLASALICALQTVTTTAVHMSRLQGLKECDYQSKTRTCTCYTIRLDSNADFVDATARFVFDGIDDCGMVHGALYSCLRALFGLSVVGVLVAVISCMLVYQLLSHERKKMYWEQLELRCRSLYNGQPPPPHGLATIGQAGAPIVDGTRCRCCEQCHAHGMSATASYPWSPESAGIRFWTGPAGNFYSPNPGGEEMRMAMTGSGIRSGGTNQSTGGGGGWSWPRMPWQRTEPSRFRHPTTITPSSPDSQYGFGNNGGGGQGMVAMDGHHQFGGPQQHGGYSVIGSAPYSVWGPPPPYSDPNSPARRGGGGGGRYQYIQSTTGQPQMTTPGIIMGIHNEQSMNMGEGGNHVRQSQVLNVVECHHQQQQNRHHHHHQSQQPQQQQQCPGVMGGRGHSSTEGPHSLDLMYNNNSNGNDQHQHLHNYHQQQPPLFSGHQKDFYENSEASEGTATTTNISGTIKRGDTNSLPTRKTKKRVEAVAVGAKSVGLNTPTQRVNVQDVFNNINNNNNATGNAATTTTSNGDGPLSTQPRMTASGIELSSADVGVTTVESTFQSQTKETESLLKNILEPAEVYFGDVSSCCNVSVQQDNLYHEATTTTHLARNQGRPIMLVAKEDEEKDYLAQRFGNREASIRSRMPFPQTSSGCGGVAEELTRAKLIPPMVQPRKSLLLLGNNNNSNQEQPSRHSMCSLDSDAKTEVTDLSPNTPCVAMNLNEFHGQFEENGENSAAGTNFVASFPYSSTEQSQEAVRRPTTKVATAIITQQECNGNSPQYEVIPEHSAAAGGPVNGTPRLQKPNAYLGHHVAIHSNTNEATSNHNNAQQHQIHVTHNSPVGRKNSNVTPIKRRNISTDISSIIGSIGSDVSLMYQDRREREYPGSGPVSDDNFSAWPGREDSGDVGARL